MQIYWIHKGQRCGPVSVPDILAKIQLGELSPDSLGWHSGCTEWLPLRDLPALADFLNTPSPEEPEEAPAAAPDQPTPPDDQFQLKVMLPGPGIRFLARLADLALYATAVLTVMYVLQVPYNRYFQPGTPLFWLPMIFIEAFMLIRWRTTPGKRWLGIGFQSIRGSLTYGAALMRSMLVFILGIGCMNPIFALVTMALSYIGVSRRGVTLWDLRSGTLPMVGKSPSQGKIIFVIIFLFISVQLCSLYLQPWLPDMLQELQENSPEAAHMLEEWMSGMAR